jgi:hypothetical protein
MEMSTTSSPRKSHLPAFLVAILDVTHAEWLLWGCCLCSGLVDSTIYNGE